MRSTCRSFLAAILFIVAAGIASAQDSSAAPPPAAPDVAKPVDQLPAIPFAGPSAAPVEPGVTIDPSVLATEPVVAAQVEAPAEKVAENPAAATVPHATKKTARKPAVHVSESVKPAEPATNPAVVATTELPPAAAPVAPLQSVVLAPAAAGPAVETLVEETKPQARMGIGSWFLAGIVVVALFGIFTLMRRRISRRQSSIPDFTAGQDLKPVLAERH